MSTTIDERVVSMEFDNSHFEKNVRTTMSTLDKLKQSLNLGGASKGLERVNSAASRFKSTGLGSAVEAVGLKFNAMYSTADQALRNITNSAINAGKRIVSALTIDPVKTGLQEYETKINAIQVIKANTRGINTMDEITDALDELNTYADKTIYNFAQMTSNIGKFTAQGLDVKEAANAVKGMANLAAASGASAEDMSRATYQMSQALSSSIRLQDWNSLRTANMATTQLKNTLIDLAKVHGIAIDDMIAKEGDFEHTLSSGWLTGDMFTEAMNIYSGIYSEAELKSMGFTESQISNFKDLAQTAESAATEVKTFSQLWDVLKETAQSGWTQSWEYIIGDFETAKKDLTKAQIVLSDLLNKSAEARNEVLKEWNNAGGRDDLIESLKNIYKGIESIVVPLKESFQEIFPPMTAEKLLKITKAIHDFTAKLKLSDSQSEKLKSTFKGLFSIVKVGVNILSGLLKGILKVVGSLSGFANLTLDIGASFGEWATNISESIIKTNIFGKAIDKVSEFLSKASNKITEFLKYSRENFVPTGFEGFVELLSKLWDSLTKVGGKFLEVGLGIGDSLANVFGSSSLKSLFDLVNSGLLTAILVFVTKIVKGFSEASKGIEDIGSSLNPLNEIKNIIGGVKGVLESVGETLKTWQTTLKVGMLLKLAIAIGVLAVALVTISAINPERLAQSLGAITVLFADLLVSMNVFNKIKGDYNNAFKAITVMIGMSIAISILASSLKKISNLKFDELMVGLVGISNLLAMLVIVAKVIGRDDKAMIKGASQMVIMSIAIKILASAINDLGSMDWDKIGRGLSAMAGALTALTLAMNLMPKNMFSTSVGLTIAASSLLILYKALKQMSSMNFGEIGKAMLTLGSSIAILAIGLNCMSDTLQGSEALLVAAVALNVFAPALQKLGSMSLAEIGKGLLTIAGTLVIIGVASFISLFGCLAFQNFFNKFRVFIFIKCFEVGVG